MVVWWVQWWVSLEAGDLEQLMVEMLDETTADAKVEYLVVY